MILEKGWVVPLLTVAMMMNPFGRQADGSQDEKGEPSVRASILAGSWYEGDSQRLQAQLDRFLGAVEEEAVGPGQTVAALIAPHAGYVYSGQCAAYAYKTIAGRPYSLVVIIGPSHRAYFKGMALPEADFFETPLGRVPVDRDVCGQLERHPLFTVDAAAHKNEHSLEIQLPFLQHVLAPGFRIVPLVAGEMSRKDFSGVAEAMKPYCVPGTLFVASSDFTHYGTDFGYVPFRDDIRENLARLDGGAVEEILQLDFDGFLDYQQRTGATICGFRPIGLLLKLFGESGDGPDVTVKQLKYCTSGELTGDWKHTVSYESIVFLQGDGGGDAVVAERSGEPDQERSADGSRPESTGEEGMETDGNPGDGNGDSAGAAAGKAVPAPEWSLTEAEQETLLSLARQTLEVYVKEGRAAGAPAPETLTPTLQDHCGAFVTLHMRGRLRGCIGYIQGVKPLWETVVDNTINAASNDPRFSPVSPGELKDIDIEISVLSPLKKISDTEVVEVGKHGLYIVKGFSSGLLLPQVATEQNWDRTTFLEHVCLKAGLSRNDYKRGAEIYIFTAQVFGEK